MRLNLPIEEICKKYLIGMNSVELAKEYNCCPDTIVKRLRGNGIEIRTNSEVQIKRHTENINSYYIKLPIKEICEEYQNGVSADKLAKKYNCSAPTIIQRLRDNNINIRSYIECQIGLQSGKNNPHYINLPIDEICEKYINGMNTVELAKEYECSSTAINQRLCNNGVTLRTTSEMERTLEHCQRISAAHQGIPYDKWKHYISKSKYCQLFNPKFKEKIRISYNRRCFLCGKSEEENGQRHDIHHVNYDKDCLCGLQCEFVPLCRSCHMKTNYNRKYWEDLIMNYLYPNKYFMVEI